MKNLLFGLIALGTALGTSAFTNAPSKTSFATRYWVNNGTNYVLFTSGVPNTSTKCQNTSSQTCAIQSEDATIPSSFPIANVSLYTHTNVAGSTPAVYVP